MGRAGRKAASWRRSQPAQRGEARGQREASHAPKAKQEESFTSSSLRLAGGSASASTRGSPTSTSSGTPAKAQLCAFATDSTDGGAQPSPEHFDAAAAEAIECSFLAMLATAGPEAGHVAYSYTKACDGQHQEPEGEECEDGHADLLRLAALGGRLGQSQSMHSAYALQPRRVLGGGVQLSGCAPAVVALVSIADGEADSYDTDIEGIYEGQWQEVKCHASHIAKNLVHHRSYSEKGANQHPAKNDVQYRAKNAKCANQHLAKDKQYRAVNAKVANQHLAKDVQYHAKKKDVQYRATYAEAANQRLVKQHDEGQVTMAQLGQDSLGILEGFELGNQLFMSLKAEAMRAARRGEWRAVVELLPRVRFAAQATVT